MSTTEINLEERLYTNFSLEICVLPPALPSVYNGEEGRFLLDKKLTIYTDGCSKGNPGPASIGVVMYENDNQNPCLTLSKEIGITTNNQAEYKALIKALEYAVAMKATKVEVRSDSELIVNQMNGRYRVKKAELKPLHEEAQRLAGQIDSFRILSVPREENRGADKMANMAFDKE